MLVCSFSSRMLMLIAEKFLHIWLTFLPRLLSSCGNALTCSPHRAECTLPAFRAYMRLMLTFAI